MEKLLTVKVTDVNYLHQELKSNKIKYQMEKGNRFKITGVEMTYKYPTVNDRKANKGNSKQSGFEFEKAGSF